MPKARAVSLLAALLVGGCGLQNPISPSLQRSGAPSTHTFVLRSPSDPRLPAPGTEEQAETAADRALLAEAIPTDDAGTGGAVVTTRRTITVGRSAPAGPPPSVVWNKLTTELGAAAKLPPPLFARGYALVQVGIYDALVAARDHDRGIAGDHAVAAGAAYEVLNYLFPSQAGRIADLAGEQVAFDGGDGNARAARGWMLGRAVGQLVVQRGMADGSDAVFTGPIPTGDGIWTGVNPVLPMCGIWKTWIITSGDAIQPQPPYPFNSVKDLADVDEVYQVSLHVTPEQIAIVHKWADTAPPAIWNNLLDDQIAARGPSTFDAARAHAYLNVAMADAFICCWNTKYAFWIARPFQRIPGLVTVIPTPNFPSYTSGHSTISAAAADVMGELFPDQNTYFQGQADEAAISRLWGGIHFRHDNQEGATVGHKIGAKVVAVMEQDGGGQIAAE